MLSPKEEEVPEPLSFRYKYGPHQRETSSTTFTRGSTHHYTLLSFPRITFPTLQTIKTISNTRIDKTNTTNNNNQQHHHQKQLKPIAESCQEDIHHENVLVNKFHTIHSRYLDVSSTPNTARDSHFSYDYETYMLHVAGNNNNAKTLNNSSSIPLLNAGNYGGWDQNQDKESPHHINTKSKDPNPTTFIPYYPSFGMELLDLSDSIIIRQCPTPTSVVEEALRESGTDVFGPIYEVSTKSGSPMLYMTETTNCMNRLLSCSWIGFTRSFTAQIVDVCGKLSMTVTNSGIGFCCCCSLFCCCSTWFNWNNNEFRVNFASGEVLGTVCQTRGDNCNPGFDLRDSELRKILHAKGPRCSICDKLSSILSVLCCCFSCLIDDDMFHFTEKGGKPVAQIRKIKVKVEGGENKELGDKVKKRRVPISETLQENQNENLDYYDNSYQVLIDFGPGVDLRTKSLILSAGFVIDFLYWQSSSVNKH